MPDNEAKNVLERLGFADILTRLCPGAVLLASVAIWLPLCDLASRNKLEELVNSTPASFLLLLISYAMGLVLNGWAAQGFVKSVELYSGLANYKGAGRVLPLARLAIAAILHGRRFKTSQEADVAARFQIYEFIRTRYGESVVNVLNPNSFLYVFRVLVWCIAREREEVSLNEADALFRRRGFAEGVALAAMLVALESLIELLLIWRWRLAHSMTWIIILLGILAASVAASLLLRNVAWRLHSDERIFTYAILHSVKGEAGGATVE